MTEHIVFWSGGQDSTLVALQLLRERKFITLVSYDNCWIGGEHQQNLEKIHRKRLLHKLITEFGVNSFKHKTYTWDGDMETNHGEQNKLWTVLFPLACPNDSIAYFGAVKMDDFWHFKDEWIKTFNQICKYQYDKKVEIKFPLEWYTKKMVKKELAKYGYLNATIHSGDKL